MDVATPEASAAARAFKDDAPFSAFVNSGSKLDVSVSDFNLGLKGGVINFFVRSSQLISAKKGCLFNSSASSVAPSLCFWVPIQETLHKVSTFGSQSVSWETDLAKGDILVHLLGVFGIKGTPTTAHFKNENSQ